MARFGRGFPPGGKFVIGVPGRADIFPGVGALTVAGFAPGAINTGPTRLYLRDTVVSGTRYALSTAQGAGTTLVTGSESGSSFVEKLRWEYEVGAAGLSSTSVPTSIDVSAVSAATLEYRWAVVKVDSTGAITASSAYSAAYSTTGIKAETLTLSTTWAAGDKIGISLELRKVSGGGSRSVTLNINDADSYADVSFGITPVTARPGVGALTVAGLAPTAAAGASTSVSPGVGALTAAGLQPNVVYGINAAPAVGQLDLSGLAPTAAVTDTPSIQPDVGALTLDGLAVSVAVSDNKIASPSAGALDLSGLAPSVEATGNQAAASDTGALSLTGLTPVVTASDRQIVTALSGALSLSGLAPSVAATENQRATPGLGQIALAGLAPSVVASDNQYALPHTGVLHLSGFAPSAYLNRIVSTGTGTLTLVGRTPETAIKLAVPWTVELHDRRFRVGRTARFRTAVEK